MTYNHTLSWVLSTSDLREAGTFKWVSKVGVIVSMKLLLDYETILCWTASWPLRELRSREHRDYIAKPRDVEGVQAVQSVCKKPLLRTYLAQWRSTREPFGNSPVERRIKRKSPTEYIDDLQAGKSCLLSQLTIRVVSEMPDGLL